SLAVGQPVGGDVQIVLFVKLAAGVELDDALRQTIRQSIKENLTPRHVPAKIIGVRDIPYTRSGKKVELAVTRALAGEAIDNLGALANREAMDEYIKLGANP